MKWYYAIKDRQLGPVSEARLEELRREGVIVEDTLVWHMGLADWRPVHAVLPPLAPPGANDALCAECRKLFPKSEMICLNRAWICVQCKPVYLQRLSEGVAPLLGVGEMWRKDRLLILHAETTFPDRCVRCNAPANGFRVRCQVHWAPTGRIVLSHMRAVVRVGLCKRHRKRRQIALTISSLAVLSGVGMVLLEALLGSGFSILGGLSLIFAGFLAVAHFSALVQATKIADGVIWLRGAGKPFLAELPEWTGDR